MQHKSSSLTACSILLFLFVCLLSITACATPEVQNPYDNKPKNQEIAVHNYTSCVQAGNPTTRSMPPKCISSDGTVFVDESIEYTNKSKPQINHQNSGNCKDLCGDGVCQQMVCMAIGCPCAETVESCRKDCVGDL